MNIQLVSDIMDQATQNCKNKNWDPNESTAWAWEGQMVQVTINKLRYVLASNGYALTPDQRSIIQAEFDIVV